MPEGRTGIRGMGAAGLPCSHPGTGTQPWARLSPPLWGQGRATQGSGISLHVAFCVSCSSQGKAHPRAKPPRTPWRSRAARTSSGGCRTFCRYFFSTSSGVLPVGERVKGWEKPTARGSRRDGGHRGTRKGRRDHLSHLSWPVSWWSCGRSGRCQGWTGSRSC